MRAYVAIALLWLVNYPADINAATPSKEAIREHLNAQLRPGWAVKSFDWKSFPSKIEEGSGRTNVEGELQASSELFASATDDFRQEYLKGGGQASDLNRPVNIYKVVVRQGAILPFKAELFYKETARSVDLRVSSLVANFPDAQPKTKLSSPQPVLLGSPEYQTMLQGLLKKRKNQDGLRDEFAKLVVQQLQRKQFDFWAVQRQQPGRGEDLTKLYRLAVSTVRVVPDGERASFRAEAELTPYVPMKWSKKNLSAGATEKVELVGWITQTAQTKSRDHWTAYFQVGSPGHSGKGSFANFIWRGDKEWTRFAGISGRVGSKLVRLD